jgi:hypothetical protein
VTGGTGFIASHCVEAALDKGYAGTCFYECKRREERGIRVARRLGQSVMCMPWLYVTRLVLSPPSPVSSPHDREEPE